jgi:hypothetical protein
MILNLLAISEVVEVKGVGLTHIPSDFLLKVLSKEYSELLVVVLRVKECKRNALQREKLQSFFLESLALLDEPNCGVTCHVFNPVERKVEVLILEDNIGSAFYLLDDDLDELAALLVFKPIHFFTNCQSPHSYFLDINWFTKHPSNMALYSFSH